MKLKDKVALITGGSLGLGKATAFLFAKEGAKVIITGRTESKLQDTVDEAKKEGLEIDYLVGDVSDENRTIETVNTAKSIFCLIMPVCFILDLHTKQTPRYGMKLSPLT